MPLKIKSLDRDEVYRLTAQIPQGMVSTYGLLAKAAGNPRGARAVGVLMKLNPTPVVVPCHRVVCSDGRIGGYSRDGGVDKKIKLLASEGVYVLNGRVVDFEEKIFREFR